MKKRVLTSIYILILFLVFFKLKNIFFMLSLNIIVLYAYYEIVSILFKKKSIVIVNVLLLQLILIIFYNVINIFMLNPLIWLLNILIIFLYYKKYKINKYIINISLFLTFYSFFKSFIYIHNFQNYSLYPFFIISLSDSLAYFFGKKFGKNKIIFISPNKTWEGLLISCFFVNIINIFILKIKIINFVLLNIFFISAFIGDLYQSTIKRIYKIKNSGNILPGHGGINDRIDSIISGISIYIFIHKILFS